MEEPTISKKRAARMLRRKAKVAALFHIGNQKADDQAMGSDMSEPILTDEDYKQLKNQIKEKKKIQMRRPQLRQARTGLRASLNEPKKSRVPVFAADVQSLVLHSLVGDAWINHPFELFKMENWAELSSVNVLVVDNVGVDEYVKDGELFARTKAIFDVHMEMCNPVIENADMALALSFVPLSVGALGRVIRAFGPLEDALRRGFIHNIQHLIKKKKEDAEEDVQVDREGMADEDIAQARRPCSRLDLLLSSSQLVVEQYPLPGQAACETFLPTNSAYQPVTDASPLYSVDCEFVTCQGGVYGLARVAVVDERLECVYHTLVKPALPIIDYQTRYSGITAAMLDGVTTTLEEVQRCLRQLLPADAIIVGQSVGTDLTVLRLMHPYIIDTGVIFNLTGNPMAKTKLSSLTELFLKRSIQKSRSGHDPVEDALAAMELVLLKLRMGKSFGDVLLDQRCDRWIPSHHRVAPATLAALNRLFQNPDHVTTEKEEHTFHPSCCLHQKLFTFLQWHGVTCHLVTQLEFLDRYNPQMRALGGLRFAAGAATAEPVKIAMVAGLDEAARKTVEAAALGERRPKFTLTHSSVDAFMPVDRRKKLLELDRAVERLYESCVATNGLLMVVLSGRRTPLQNGACLIRVRSTPTV